MTWSVMHPDFRRALERLEQRLAGAPCGACGKPAQRMFRAGSDYSVGRLIHTTCVHCAAVTTHAVDVLMPRPVVVGNER